MTIHESIKASLPEAMKAREALKLEVLRGLSSAMTNEVVAKKRKPSDFLTDEEALAVLKRSANQRKDSIEQFEKAGRQELADKEKAELALIETLLPTMMSREEIAVVVKAKIVEAGDAVPKSDSGRFTGLVMKELKGKADGADVKAVIDSLLT